MLSKGEFVLDGTREDFRGCPDPRTDGNPVVVRAHVEVQPT